MSSFKIINSFHPTNCRHVVRPTQHYGKSNHSKVVISLLLLTVLLLVITPAFSTSTTEKTKTQKALHRLDREFYHHHHGEKLINHHQHQQINDHHDKKYISRDGNRIERGVLQQEKEENNRKRKVSTLQASVVPTFSLPSIVNLYANTPLYIPIILTNEVTSGTTFEYIWKVYNSTNGITLASGSTPTVYIGEYDLDILKTVTYYQNVKGSISSPVSSWSIYVEVTSRGDYGIIIDQYKKTIPFNLYLLGVFATIVGENQDMNLITDLNTNQILNISMSTITPKIEYYDSAVSKLFKSNGQCSWTCTYTLTSGSVKNCTNFDTFRRLSNDNCQSFNVIGKSEEDILTVKQFNIGLIYKYSSFYYVESEKYEINMNSIRSNDSIPIFQSISSNTTMQQYHPPNLPITLTPNVVNYNSNLRVIYYWEINGNSMPKQNITLDSLSPNTKYVATCEVYFLGNIQKYTSMTFTFFTANNVTKPKFNIVTSSALAFQTRVQISGYIGESNSGPLCMTEIFAETSTYGKISLTNGRPVCLQSLTKTSTDAMAFLRLPLKKITLYDNIKLTFVVTDGISIESFSVTTSSSPTSILDNYSSQNIVKLTSSVLESTSTLYENDRTLLPSHILVASSMIMEFKASTEESNAATIEYSTLTAGLGSYLSKICSSSSSYLPLDQNLNCIENIGKYLSISSLTTTFSSTSLSQSTSSNIVTLVFYQLNQLVFNSVNGKGTLQNSVLFQKFLNEGGETYVGLLVDMLQIASSYISQDFTSIPTNGTYISINSNTITSTVYSVSNIFLSISSSSTFKSSSSLITKLDLSSFQSTTSYSLLSGSIVVQLPPLTSILGGLTSSSSLVLSLQVSPQNNKTDSANSTTITSRKIQFQLLDPITSQKLELKDLSKPITLQLPITYSALSNSSRDSSKCVFWSDSLSAWSNEGCTLKQATQSNFYCECNHTTTFAVLSNTLTTITNNTQVETTSFDLIPLIVISSVTGGVILITLVLSGVIQAFIHILKNVDSPESGDLFLPAEFFPVNTKLPEKPKETTEEPKEEKEPKVKKRYKDLSFGFKILECLKEFHPVLGIFFPKKYFKTVHIKRLDRVIILMDIFIITSTVNVILLSVSTISASWIFVIPSLISFGCSVINQIPVTLLFCRKQAIWKVCAYGYSCVFAFVCLVISIIASAGVFVSNKWNMNILNWLYATILGVAWDLIVFRIVLAAVIAFLIEVKVTIDMGIAAFRNTKDTDKEELPLQTRRMVTVQNNVRIPMLFSQKEKPSIPKLNLKAVEGVATPKENPVNELSSMHASPTASASSSSSGVDSYFSPHKDEPAAEETKVTFVNIEPAEEAKTSNNSDHSTSKEAEQLGISPGCIMLDSPGLSPISPLVPKYDHDMSFIEKVQLRDELNMSENQVDEAIIPPVLEDTFIVDQPPKEDDNELVNEPTQTVPNEQDENIMEQPEEIKELVEDVEQQVVVEEIISEVIPIESVPEETKPEEIILTEEVLNVEVDEHPSSPKEEKTEEPIPEPAQELPLQEELPVVEEQVIESVIEPTKELPEIDTKKNPIKILKEILKEKEVPPVETSKPHEPKEKSEKNILEYIEQVSEHEKKITEQNLESLTLELLERLSGKTLSEILLILSEVNDQQSSQPMYSSPMRTNSPVARNALQKNTPGNKSARMLKSGGIEVDRIRKRSLSFNKLYGIEETMIKPQTDFFDQIRFFIRQNYSGEAQVKVLNELLFLQCIYLHYKIISVTPETRKEMAEQVLATFLNEKEQYHINIGFYKRVLASCITDDNLNANTFERACEIIEIALKPVIANFLKHVNESQSNVMTSV